MAVASAAFTAVPRIASMRSSRTWMGPETGILPGYVSMKPLQTRPPDRSAMSCAARSRARTTPSGSIPLSNRNAASVPMPRNLAPRRIVDGLKYALSSSTVSVSSLTSEFSPPMIPAMATGLRPSQIISVSAFRVRVLPSRETKGSPCRERRTTILPSSRNRKSKACRGCPNSIMTKFVTSTTLLMALSPTASRRCRIHFGEGWIFTPLIMRAVYRGQRSGSRISTEVIDRISSPDSLKEIFG